VKDLILKLSYYLPTPGVISVQRVDTKATPHVGIVGARLITGKPPTGVLAQAPQHGPESIAAIQRKVI